jgi:hypothetical protein
MAENRKGLSGSRDLLEWTVIFIPYTHAQLVLKYHGCICINYENQKVLSEK